MSLTVQPTIGTESTFARQAGSAESPRSRSVTFGSALETTTGAWIRSPPASSTPSPGKIRATGTSVATTAPSALAASQSRNETMPIPPTTYPHIPGSPPRRPEAWWKWTEAVPGS